jgi:pyrroloquinoline quinone biosynthesis protein D
VIPATGKPALAPKARLRFDRISGGYMLLYPERGLELNATAASILKLCDGARTLDGIVGELSGDYIDRSGDDIRREVVDFLEDLLKRGLLRVLG